MQWGREQVAELLAASPRGSMVYLLGAGGCGMSGLGHLLMDCGMEVAGSDLNMSAAARQLRSRGADIQLGHSPGHLEEWQPALVAYTSALRRDNPALERARRLGVPLVQRGTLLAALMDARRGVCVSGMHGKTTTTGLLAHALRLLDNRTGHAVGGEVMQWERSARMAADDGFFVVEADESDGTLLRFHPEQSIVLNVDEEHLEYYANLEAVCEEFAEFGEQTSGTLFYCADDPRLVELFAGRDTGVSFGFSPAADYRVEPVGESSFELYRGWELLARIGLRLFGEKNLLNAAAAAAFLHHNGFEADSIAEALGEFGGVGRRQQVLLNGARCRVIDDYAHHPREIAATLRAMKAGGKRVFAAFQPHRYTRTQHLLKDFAGCFTEADRVWITEVYAASEPAIPEVNGRRLAGAVAATGATVEFVSSLSKLREQVGMAAGAGDVIAFLGAGDITQVAQQVAMDMALEEGPVGDSLRALLSAESVVLDEEPLATRTTLKVGGPAEVYVEPASEADLAKVIQFCARREVPVFLLGRGSNLLVRDGGIRGVVIRLSHEAFVRLEVRGERLFAGAGVTLRKLAREAKEHGIAELEFMEGIPGALGGALRMNAGAMGSMMFNVVESMRFMDRKGEMHELAAAEIETEYRNCPMLREHIALGATLAGKRSTVDTVGARMKGFAEHRLSSQPGARSAGCMFKNPSAECPAGRLVEELGLKGVRVGGAVVSDVHGNFIVNEGGATAADVESLIGLVMDRARAERGIELHKEVQIVGEKAR